MWKRFLILLCIPVLSGGASSCQGHIPVWTGKIYAHDGLGNIVRKQSNEVLSCSDPRAKLLMGMTWDDFQSFYETYVLGCKVWKNDVKMISVTEAWQMLSVIQAEKPQ